MKQFFLVFILIIFSASVCIAENAYKWTDDQGRVFFGSKPPKNATGVSAVKAATYSRYKASPALTKLKKTEGRARLGNIKEADIALPIKDTFEVKNDAPTKESQLELSSETPVVKVGAQDEIESCSVTVKNKTPVDVEGVQVSFEFSDGTLVPAVGPARLNVGQGALYSIDTEQLPLKLETGANTTPKIIINTDGETVIKPPVKAVGK
jgi:hypothetical protein